MNRTDVLTSANPARASRDEAEYDSVVEDASALATAYARILRVSEIQAPLEALVASIQRRADLPAFAIGVQEDARVPGRLAMYAVLDLQGFPNVSPETTALYRFVSEAYTRFEEEMYRLCHGRVVPSLGFLHSRGISRDQLKDTLGARLSGETKDVLGTSVPKTTHLSLIVPR